jgi:hypothetical protein
MGHLGRALAGSTEVSPLHDFGTETDVLAERSAAFARCIRRRDAAYLRWRWLEQPGPSWSALGARVDGRLSGWVVFGIDDRRSGRFITGYVVDLLAEDARSMRLLLVGAARELVRAGCELIEFDFVDPRPWAASACRRAGFLLRGKGDNVVCKALTPGLGPVVEDLDNWYLTKSDSDLA